MSRMILYKLAYLENKVHFGFGKDWKIIPIIRIRSLEWLKAVVSPRSLFCNRPVNSIYLALYNSLMTLYSISLPSSNQVLYFWSRNSVSKKKMYSPTPLFSRQLCNPSGFGFAQLPRILPTPLEFNLDETRWKRKKVPYCLRFMLTGEAWREVSSIT